MVKWVIVNDPNMTRVIREDAIQEIRSNGVKLEARIEGRPEWLEIHGSGETTTDLGELFRALELGDVV